MKTENGSQEIVFTWKMFFVSFSLLIGLSPLFLYIAYRNSQRKAIRHDQALTRGGIIRFTYSIEKRGPRYITYVRYRVKNQSYTCSGKTSKLLTVAQRDSLIGVWLPVIYERADPSNSYLLSSEQAFGRFDLHFPDSLAWTKLYFTD